MPELYLATDADREGEAIAWHLLQVLKPKVPVYRHDLHRDHQEGIDPRAAERARDRRATWSTPRRPGGSWTGSTATRSRRCSGARSARASPPVGSSPWPPAWSSSANANAWPSSRPATGTSPAASPPPPRADVHRQAHRRRRRPRGHRIDFNDRGELKSTGPSRGRVLDGEAAERARREPDRRGVHRRLGRGQALHAPPSRPFITSTLQQEAARSCASPPGATMQVAQRLYENGYITYMRTDSVTLSDEAITAARRQIDGALRRRPRARAARASTPRRSRTRRRPTRRSAPPGDPFRTPGQVAASSRGRVQALRADLEAHRGLPDGGRQGRRPPPCGSAPTSPGQAGTPEFAASGTVITFPGFLAAYEEGRRGHRRGRRRARPKATSAPADREGDAARRGATCEAEGHGRTPPPRYTEATIVKELEERGIGRPSTYAATISTIMDRGYVIKRGSALIPSLDRVLAWCACSRSTSASYVDYDFTADMEEDLDQIARGELQREPGCRASTSAPRTASTGSSTWWRTSARSTPEPINSIEIAGASTCGWAATVPTWNDRPRRVVDADGELEPQRANLPRGPGPR